MARITPAQLAFLAIYNPDLGDSEETFSESLVFYYSKATADRRRNDKSGKAGKAEAALKQAREDENERLRQIGLAQGMVDFARNFSSGKPIDSIETEKSRIVLHELEKGWWILASVNLTQLTHPTQPPTGKSSDSTASLPKVEYSAREVSPSNLLVQQLIRAYTIFLLHHGSSLSDLYVRLSRIEFSSYLDRFWSRFAGNWDVMLHGCPGVDVFHGIKLAAGGELGIGVGEEEWGSGEREVLEDFARRTDGLVDLVVSRFGEPSPSQQQQNSKTPVEKGKKNDQNNASQMTLVEPWMANGGYPDSADGVIFSGVGVVSRSSVRSISHWMEWIYAYGDHAYGVKDNPGSSRRKRRRRPKQIQRDSNTSAISVVSLETPGLVENERRLPEPSSATLGARSKKGIPPPLVRVVEGSLDNAVKAVEQRNSDTQEENGRQSAVESETWLKYLTLGYGSAWGPRKSPGEDEDVQSFIEERSMQYLDPEPEFDRVEERVKTQIRQEDTGTFLIGLKRDMATEVGSNPAEEEQDVSEEWNNRIFIRAVWVEVARSHRFENQAGLEDKSISDDGHTVSDKTKLTRLRVVIYVHRPFIYTFLFEPTSPALSLTSFYTNLHTYFSSLHRSLSPSTSPQRVAARIAAASYQFTTSPVPPSTGLDEQPIFDLVYDPQTLTVHTSIPSIIPPRMVEGLASGDNSKEDAAIPGWTRLDALNVHSQLLSIIASTRRKSDEVERTCKTNRGWWVVWLRLRPSDAEGIVAPSGHPQSSSPGERQRSQPSDETLKPENYKQSNREGSTPGKKENALLEKEEHSSAQQEAGPGENTSESTLDPMAVSPNPQPGGIESNNEPHHQRRLSEPSATSYPTSIVREAFLVRRARDATSTSVSRSKSNSNSGVRGGISASSFWRFGGQSTEQKMGGVAAGWGPRGFGEGIGIDARRYVEGLLSLNR